jgi:2-polyprenyl-6-hydroxyphenyl methylase/3-demethylubiquinone-9 3-methyltransferase
MIQKKKDDAVDFHEELASDWSKKYKNSHFFRERFKVITSVLKRVAVPQTNWLDAGCGDGIFSTVLIDLGANLHGVDGSNKMIALAQDKEPRGMFQVVENLCTYTDYPKHFDGILCSSVLEYLHEPNSVLSIFNGSLKKDGVLVITVPNSRSLIRSFQNSLRALDRSRFQYLNTSKNSYSQTDFQAVLNQAGFRVVAKDYIDPYFSNLPLIKKFSSLMSFVAVKVE